MGFPTVAPWHGAAMFVRSVKARTDGMACAMGIVPVEVASLAVGGQSAPAVLTEPAGDGGTQLAQALALVLALRETLPLEEPSLPGIEKPLLGATSTSCDASWSWRHPPAGESTTCVDLQNCCGEQGTGGDGTHEV